MRNITRCFLFILSVVLSGIPGVSPFCSLWASVAGHAARPEIVDRWSNPEANPSFAFSAEEDLLEIWYPRMTNRDATIFLYQGECWLLDCSDDWEIERITSILKALGIEKIDRVINTHPHPDHIEGLALIHEVCPVKELMIAFPVNTTESGRAAVDFAKENGIRVTRYYDEDVLPMGDGMVRFQCWMKTDPNESLNDRSAQFLVTYGERSVYFAADITASGQKQLLESVPAEALKADALRYPHHGKHALNDDFYNAIDPKMIIITNAMKAAGFGEGMKYAEGKQIPVVYTANGLLRMRTDGVTLLCEKVNNIDQKTENRK